MTIPTILWKRILWSSGKSDATGVARSQVKQYRSIRTTMKVQLKLRHMPVALAMITQKLEPQYLYTDSALRPTLIRR